MSFVSAPYPSGTPSHKATSAADIKGAGADASQASNHAAGVQPETLKPKPRTKHFQDTQPQETQQTLGQASEECDSRDFLGCSDTQWQLME